MALPLQDDAVGAVAKPVEGGGAEQPVGMVTSPDGFPTMGDLATLEGPVIPLLDWSSIGGVPTTVEGCRAVIRFIVDSFEPKRIDPIRTRIGVTSVPDLGPLASACEMEDVDLVLIIDGVDGERVARMEAKVMTTSRGTRLPNRDSSSSIRGRKSGTRAGRMVCSSSR